MRLDRIQYNTLQQPHLAKLVKEVLGGRLIAMAPSSYGVTDDSYAYECGKHPGVWFAVRHPAHGYIRMEAWMDALFSSIIFAAESCVDCRREKERAAKEEWKGTRWPEGAEL